MGSIEDIVAACAGTGLPVFSTRYEDDAADKGSHVVVRYEGTRAFMASGGVQARADQWSVTLYAERFEPSLVEAVEAALEQAAIPAGDSMSGYDDEHRVFWCEWDFETVREQENEND